MGATSRESSSRSMLYTESPMPDDLLSEGGRLLPNLEFRRVARTKLTDVFRILRHVGLRQAHLCETLCFLPIAKPV